MATLSRERTARLGTLRKGPRRGGAESSPHGGQARARAKARTTRQEASTRGPAGAGVSLPGSRSYFSPDGPRQTSPIYNRLVYAAFVHVVISAPAIPSLPSAHVQGPRTSVLQSLTSPLAQRPLSDSDFPQLVK